MNIQFLSLFGDPLASMKTFVQIGAFDGVSHDNSVEWIERYQLSGLMVEPIACHFAALQDNVKELPIILDCVAVTDYDGTAEMVYVPAEFLPGLDGGLDGSSSVLENVKNNIVRVTPENMLEHVDVPCLRFDSLMAKHGITQFDILLTDTEGYDKRILDQVDLDKYGVSLMEIETMWLSPSEQQEITDRLLSMGFRVANDTCNMTAIRGFQERRFREAVSGWLHSLGKRASGDPG